jgi:hypothetical protein
MPRWHDHEKMERLAADRWCVKLVAHTLGIFEYPVHATANRHREAERARIEGPRNHIATAHSAEAA